MKDYSGTFIVVEGGDGAGTTTQSKKLAKALDAYWTAEHGARRDTGGLVGRKVEEMISSDNYSPEAVALGFAADRMIHLEEDVIPRLEKGDIVVSDRYMYSSIVYQTVMGAKQEWVETINRYALKPDLTIILDVEADIAMDRVDSRGADGNIFEDLSFQEKVVLKYRQAAEKNANCIKIDSSRPIEKVFSDIMSEIDSRLSF